MDSDKRVVTPYTFSLPIWVAKLEMSHMLQNNKNIGISAIANQCQMVQVVSSCVN